jgi:hypothetical protein
LTDDVLAVKEAARSERPVLFATVECATLAVLFAATYPDRVAALILADPLVTLTSTDDVPGSNTLDQWENFFQRVREKFPQPM